MIYGIGVRGGSIRSELEAILWMMGLQTVFGVILTILAVMQLRPMFRHQDGETGIRVLRGLGAILKCLGRWRLRRLPVFAEQPMLWKELHTGGPRGFARFVGFLLTLICGSFLLYYTVWTAGLAIDEMWNSALGPCSTFAVLLVSLRRRPPGLHVGDRGDRGVRCGRSHIGA